MKMRYVGISVLVCLFTCSLAYGQNSDLKAIAAEQIHDLKNGTLLIKLNTQSVRIESRLKAGANKRAEKLIKEIEKEQNDIINAFNKHYTFSDYYFFYSDDSRAVIVEQDYSQLFKEKNVKLDSINSIDNPFVLILGVYPILRFNDTYKFFLHASDKKGLKPLPKKYMPRIFRTTHPWSLIGKYDFDYSIKIMQKTLEKFYEKSDPYR